MVLQDLSSSTLFHSSLLSELATRAELFSGVHLHTSFLPLSALTLAHAIRCSHGCRSVGEKARPSLVVSSALNLLLLFGSLSVVNVMLNYPSPLLLAPRTIVIYTVVHVVLALSGIADKLLEWQKTRGGALAIHIYCSAVDAVARSEGIAALGVQSVRNHPNKAIAESGFAAALCGFLIGGGTPLIIGFLGLDTASWGFRVPSWLHDPSILLKVPDIWSSLVLSTLYAGFTHPNGFSSLVAPSTAAWISRQSPAPIFVAPVAFARAALRIEPTKLAVGQILPAREARIVCAVVLFTILAAAKLGDFVAFVEPTARRAIGGAGGGTKVSARKSIPSNTIAARRAAKK